MSTMQEEKQMPINHHLLLALAKLAQHFNHDWGQWYHDPKLRAWQEDYKSVQHVHDAWYARRELECRYEGLCAIGIGPDLGHITETGRYSWFADVKNNLLILEINRGDSDGNDETVASATIQYNGDDWRGEITSLKFTGRADRRHAGYLLELLIATHDVRSTSHLFEKLIDLYARF